MERGPTTADGEGTEARVKARLDRWTELREQR